jgi:copper transport protein
MVAKRRGAMRASWRLLRHPHALFGLTLALAMLLLVGLPGVMSALIPAASAQSLGPRLPAHALLVRSDPKADARLQVPPSRVRMWYSEELNPLTSKAVVVDPANRVVNTGSSSVNSGDTTEMDIGLPLIGPGTYIVFWQTQSAQDGHVVAGSFIFYVLEPDGSMPPKPTTLPTGHFAGGAGAAVGSSTLDGPTIFQAISTWLALLAMTFWVGALIWETWILPPGGAADADLDAAAAAAARRFRRLVPYALGLLLIADLGTVMSEGAALAGSFSGAVSLPLLQAILFGSNFGRYWWLRQIVAAAALVLTLVAARRGWSVHAAVPLPEETASVAAPAAIPDWRREVLATVRGIRRLPRRLALGWQRLRWLGRVELLLGATLIAAFALSGHAAAVPPSEFAYAISVDLLHLVAEAAWVGGLFYIGLVLLPASLRLRPRQRARVIALGLPEFGVVAIICATLLAATGSLNATIRLTSIQQFLTTTYGRTLFVKIELFLIMVAISVYHAFFLRPRLALELDAAAQAEAKAKAKAEVAPAATKAAELEAVGAQNRAGGGLARAQKAPSAAASNGGGRHTPPDSAPEDNGAPPLTPHAAGLEERIRDWLRREALLGGAVLLCVALLAVFAGSLSPAPPAASSSSPGTSAPYVSQPQKAGAYFAQLTVSPDTFGTNTFTVVLRDAQGKPVTGAAVVISLTALDMDMGVANTQLQAVANTPGSYSGQADITMAGHWQVVVKVIPPNSNNPVTATFTFSATY